MGVAVIVYMGLGDEIVFSVDGYREIAALAFHLEFALSARCFDDCSFDQIARA